MGAAQGFQPVLVLKAAVSEEWLNINSLWRCFIRGGGLVAGGFGFASRLTHSVPSAKHFDFMLCATPWESFRRKRQRPALSSASL